MNGRLAWVVVVAFVLTACSSTKHTPAGSRVPAPQSVSSFQVAPGMDAAVLAAHIPGCTGATAGNVGDGAQTGMTSTAHCTLAGETVVVDVWTSSHSRDVDGLADVQTAYAAGGLWVVFTGDPGVDASRSVLQMQLTNDTSSLSTVGAQAPASLDAQKAVAGAAVKGLGGAVYLTK